MTDDRPLLYRLVAWCEILAASLLGGLLVLFALGTAVALAGAIGGLSGMALMELRLVERGGPLDVALLGAWSLAALLPLWPLLRMLWGDAR